MPTPPSVLLIDDNAATNFLHERILNRSGQVSSVKACLSATAALHYLSTKDETGGYPKPDLIFLDINMPGMSGWDFLEAYRDLPAEQRGNIVIIMLTTSLNPDDREKAKTFTDVADFQEKPLTVDEFLTIVKKHLSSASEEE